MATFLLTWNPKNYDWATLQYDVLNVAVLGESFGNWSTGVSRQPSPEDRFFLIRLGVPPKGIMASGTIESEVYEDVHWREGSDKPALYADIRFEVLFDPESEGILAREILDQPEFKAMHWDAQSSGTRIPDDVASTLERVWADFSEARPRPPIMYNVAVLEGTRTESMFYRLGRSRELRDMALAQSNGMCVACNVDFSKILGGLGTRALQVHHRQQLSAFDEPTLTKLTDLAVVCANCHALIHANPKAALSVEELRRIYSESAPK